MHDPELDDTQQQQNQHGSRQQPELPAHGRNGRGNRYGNASPAPARRPQGRNLPAARAIVGSVFPKHEPLLSAENRQVASGIKRGRADHEPVRSRVKHDSGPNQEIAGIERIAHPRINSLRRERHRGRIPRSPKPGPVEHDGRRADTQGESRAEQKRTYRQQNPSVGDPERRRHQQGGDTGGKQPQRQPSAKSVKFSRESRVTLRKCHRASFSDNPGETSSVRRIRLRQSLTETAASDRPSSRPNRISIG